MMRKFICGLCDEEFPSVESCQGHVIISHQNIADPDEVDDYNNEKLDETGNDRDTPEENDGDTQNGDNEGITLSFQCALCGEECETYDLMIRHIKSVCKQFKFTLNQMDNTGSIFRNIFCGFCSASFENTEYHLMHIIEEYCIVGGRIRKCPQCSKTFPWYPVCHYVMHMRQVHGATGFNVTNKDVLSCSRCKFSGKDPMDLIIHVAQHRCAQVGRMKQSLTPKQIQYIQFHSQRGGNQPSRMKALNRHKQAFWNQYEQLGLDSKEDKNDEDLWIRNRDPRRNPFWKNPMKNMSKRAVDELYARIPLQKSGNIKLSEIVDGSKVCRHALYKWTCFHCRKNFEGVTVLRAHLQMSHKIQKSFLSRFEAKCPSSKPKPVALFELNFFQCPFCGITKKSYSRFIEHLNGEKRFHAETNYKGVRMCTMCDKTKGYSYVPRLIEHFIMTHCKINRNITKPKTSAGENEMEERMKCCLYGCVKAFDKAWYDDHVSYVHSRIDEQLEGHSDVTYRCHGCGQMFGTVLLLVDHVTTKCSRISQQDNVGPSTVVIGEQVDVKPTGITYEESLSEQQPSTGLTFNETTGAVMRTETSSSTDQTSTVDSGPTEYMTNAGTGSSQMTFVSSLCSSDEEMDDTNAVEKTDSAGTNSFYRYFLQVLNLFRFIVSKELMPYVIIFSICWISKSSGKVVSSLKACIDFTCY